MEHPFFNGEKCVSCEEGQLFNAESKECEECPEGEEFVLATHHCQAPDVTNPEAIDRIIASDPESLKEPTEADVPCPADKPFFNVDYCMACDDEDYPYFNVDSGKCENCPDDKVLDRHTHSCVVPDLITNFDAGLNRLRIEEGQNFD